MPHPVLSDPDITAAITLTHEDGSQTPTRGQLTRGPERIDAAEAPGRLMVHAGTPANSSRVLTITALNGQVWDALESEAEAPGLETLVFDIDENWASTRYYVRRASGPVPVTDMVDFDPADFASADFN